jgi:MYXO-CTERM domain-containing protein
VTAEAAWELGREPPRPEGDTKPTTPAWIATVRVSIAVLTLTASAAAPSSADPWDVFVAGDTATYALAGATQATQCIEPFDATLQIALDLLALGLDASGNLEVASSCGSSPPVCCTGGTPSTPCGPLHLDLVEARIDAPPGTDRLDVTYQVHAATVADIPVELPAVGECFVHIDTTPGASSAVQVDLPILLSVDHLHILAAGDITLSGAESSDFQLTGGLPCSIANVGLSFFSGLLTQPLQGVFQGDASLCRLCDSTIAACVPEPGAGPLAGAALLALAAGAHRRRRAATPSRS